MKAKPLKLQTFEKLYDDFDAPPFIKKNSCLHENSKVISQFSPFQKRHQHIQLDFLLYHLMQKINEKMQKRPKNLTTNMDHLHHNIPFQIVNRFFDFNKLTSDYTLYFL